MKKLFIFLFIAITAMISCGKKELGKEAARQMIQKEKSYPRVIDYDIYCGDPKHARQVLDAGLEAKGLLTVDRTQKLEDAGKPIIHFTDAAKPFLLPTPDNDRQSHIQKVKIAEATIKDITGIAYNKEHNRAIVKYTEAYTNSTPFAILINIDLSHTKEIKAYFQLYDTGWQLEKKPGVEFMELEQVK